MTPQRRHTPDVRKRRFSAAFSLIELAMVLAISGLMVGFILKALDTGPGLNMTQCANITKGQMHYIHGAIERFARTHDRLPMPARRWVGVDGATYGREAPAADITQAAGVSFGALPWQALQMTSAYAGDCWGNKYTYMVTTALTTNATSGGYGDSTVEGNITRKTDGNLNVDTEIAYAVISHGPDGFGAVKLAYDDSAAGAVAADRKWCSGGGGALNYTNCLATAAVVLDLVAPNDGKDAGTAYFDDIIKAAGKPKMLASTNNYAYCWGANGTPVNSGNVSGVGGHDPHNLQALRPIDTSVSGPLVDVELSPNAYNACGISGTGALYCWGQNKWGEVGDGTSVRRLTPTAVSGGLTFIDFSVGDYGVCGIASGGVAYCWGYNNVNQLGDGTAVNKSVPTLVSVGALPLADQTFASIETSGNTACALTAAGKAYCWGYNVTYGSVGDGTVINRSTPQAVLGGQIFSKLKRYTYGICGLTTSNEVYCWGYHLTGAVGDGTAVAWGRPTPGKAVGLSNITDFAVSSHVTCAIDNVGAAYCWGINTRGGVGKGSATGNETSPQTVVGGHIFSSITTFYYGGCGLTTGKDAYCWGNNVFGATGTGTGTSGRGAINVPAAYILSPTIVAGGHKFSSLSIGKNAAQGCGLTIAGQLYCWGQNGYGQLGIGTTEAYSGDLNYESPVAAVGGYAVSLVKSYANTTLIQTSDGRWFVLGRNDHGVAGNGTALLNYSPRVVDGGIAFSKIYGSKAQRPSMSTSAYFCGVNTTNQAYCWGENGAGQLGDGTTISRSTPVAVSGGLSLTSLALGTYQACGLTSTGQAYCWGDNDYGQLGNATNIDSTSPVAVSGGLSFTSIYSGYEYVCGLTSAGAAYCWGQNSSYQLGDGTNTASNIPVAVGGGLTFASIAIGEAHACGLTAAGAAYCWGNNMFGQLGDTTTTTRPNPTAVSGGYTFASIAAGGYTVCALNSAGTAYCWGLNNYNVGDTTNINRSTPTLVSGGLTFSSITPGYFNTCANTIAGATYCWGTNSYGSVGDGTIATATSPSPVTGSLNMASQPIAVGLYTTCGLAAISNSCALPWGGGTPDQSTVTAFQTATPTGSCQSEYRTCTNGTLSGSYTNATCAPGCDARTVSWNGVANGCTAAVPALAGGGSTVITDAIAGPSGSATANCSATGVLTLSGATCTP